MLKVLLGIGLAIGFGALAQTASQTTGTSQSTSENEIGDLGTGGSGDGGMRHHGKHKGDGGMGHHGKHAADAGM